MTTTAPEFPGEPSDEEPTDPLAGGVPARLHPAGPDGTPAGGLPAGVTRRGFLSTAALGGAGAALVAFSASPAAAASPSAPSPDGFGARGPYSQTLTFTTGTNASATVSPDGDRLVIEVQGVLWALPRSGGTAIALTAPELEPTRPAWSPDGSLIAFCSYKGGGFHVWTMAPNGSNPRRLTSGPWDDRGVSWSPDGTRIAFASERGGDPVRGSSYDIWTVDVAAGELTRLTSRPDVEDYDTAWHPDGDRILFVRADAAGARTIASVPAAGGEVTTVRTVDAGTLMCPAVSKDGRVAFLRTAGGSKFAATSALVVDGRTVSGTEDVSPLPPCWTPDGGLLYFAGGRLKILSPSLGPARDIPFTASLDVPRPVYRRKARDFDSAAPGPVRGIHLPALSPDGGSVVFAALNALWLMPIGARPRKLFQAAPSRYVQMPSWARDGRSIVYSYDGDAGGDGLAAVHRFFPRSGEDTVLATGGRLNPALSPDGDRLACHDTTGNLLVVDVASDAETKLAAPLGGNGLPGRPSWSPDGRYIALCDRNRLNQRFREGYNVIRVIDTRDGSSRTFLPLPHTSVSDRCDSGPVWSPDGTALALVVESALWVLPVGPDGTPAGGPQRITDEPADHPSWSGDSRRLLYLSGGRLRMVNRDGTGRRTLPVPLAATRRLPPRTDVTRVHAGRLWDGTGDTVREDVDIVITGNRITAVERHRSGAGRAGERRIDASGCTVVPGLWDSHTHPYQNIYGGRQNSLMLAYGITTNVSLGGFAYEQARLREAADSGAIAGPRLLTTGELIDGSRVAYSMGRAHNTSDGLRRTLQRAIALDYDFVKTYVRAPARVMAEATRTAHERLGVPAGSHLLTPGIQVGQDLTTHLTATQRQEYGRSASATGHTYEDVHEIYRGGRFEIIITPFNALYLLGDDPALADDPRVTTLMPPWDTVAVKALAKARPTEEQLRELQREMATYRRVVTDGGTLALGTDSPLTPIGLQVHLGLRALHRYAGLSPAQTLRTATAVPARMFGVEDDLGTAEPGKLADLTVVEGNPFQDFTDLTRVSWVMRDGIVHRREDVVGPHHLAAGRTVGDSEHWHAVGQIIRRESCCGT
ncbi:amidohydrolase family protein [Streptomyces cinerochromogenes]|uniref:Amidohydrolase family protein n=1 Tax=Streptomyces cinerochromogenes TaxID=66422 RepID=A0ABW7BA36_9ACTN